jgi:hypothetical protein
MYWAITFTTTPSSSTNKNIARENTRPLVPRLVLQEDADCEEIRGEIFRRFNIPVARLVDLPPDFVNKIYSLNFGKEGKPEDYFEDKGIYYLLISSIRYAIAGDRAIYLTTLFCSPKASQLEYLLEGGEKINLKDGNEAIAFSCSHSPNKGVENFVVFVKDQKYYVTVQNQCKFYNDEIGQEAIAIQNSKAEVQEEVVENAPLPTINNFPDAK